MPALDLTINESDPNQAGLLYPSGAQLVAATIPDFVRGDKEIYLAIKTAIQTDQGFVYSHATGDTYVAAIGLPDEPSTGGEVNFDVNGSPANSIPFDATAAAFKAIFSPASVAAGFGTVTVTKLKDGVYQIDWDADGEVPNGSITGDESELIPASQIVISAISEGSISSKAQYIVEFKQEPIAIASPSSDLPAASVSVEETQAATTSLNRILSVEFSDGVAAGSFSVSVTAMGVTEGVGIGSPQMTAQEFGVMLANHSEIHYLDDDGTADNIIVRKSGVNFIVEFIGTLAGSTLRRSINDATVANPSELTTSEDHGYADGDTVTITNSSGTTPSLNGTYTITVTSNNKFTIPLNVTISSSASARVFNNSEPSISVTNIDLVAPKGKYGTMSLNTINLAKYFYPLASSVQEATFKLSVKRTRLSGEERTLLLIDVIIKRNLIDLGSLVAMPSVFDFLFQRAVINPDPDGTDHDVPVPLNCRYYTLRANIDAGSGAYTKPLVLGLANRLDGDKLEIILNMPESSDPTIEIQSDGVTIWTEYSTGAAYVRPLWFTWNNETETWESDQGAA